MKLSICKVIFDDITLSPRYSEKIRGFMGNKYKDIDLLHNHQDEKFIYRYPLVQYKIIKNIPMIIGVNEGAEAIVNIGIKDDELILEGKEYEIYEKKIVKSSLDFGCSDEYISYKFITPWIALNQNNVKAYKNGKEMEREELLKKILIGNIISMSKGLDYNVVDKINCWIDLTEKKVMLKGISHIGFLGEFKVNYNIPDYLGIGKAVSKGFGTVVKNYEIKI